MDTDQHATYRCGICLGIWLSTAAFVSGALGLGLSCLLPDWLAAIIFLALFVSACIGTVRFCLSENPLPNGDQSDTVDMPGNFGGPDYDKDGIDEGENEGSRPDVLSAARDSGADNLKLIKGIGPKLEAMLNKMGFFHFDQIADWGPEHVAWVDANLEGFKGRVSRDNWVEQARVLADTGHAE